MSKAHKLTLPNISPHSERSQPGSKKKVFKSWIMNDTFSNWKKKPSKLNSPQKLHSQLATETSAKNPTQSKSIANSGITLGEYFRTRANTENSITEETYEVPEDDILPYLMENFEIHESDEDNYEESENSIQVSNKQKSKPREQLHSQHSIMSKVKTEEDEHSRCLYAPNISKKKGVLTQKSKEKIVSINQLQESFDMKPKNKNRSLSNEVNKKIKLSENLRKNAVLEKVRADKMRASEMKNVNTELFTKYAQKFHLNDRSRQEFARPCQ